MPYVVCRMVRKGAFSFLKSKEDIMSVSKLSTQQVNSATLKMVVRDQNEEASLAVPASIVGISPRGRVISRGEKELEAKYGF